MTQPEVARPRFRYLVVLLRALASVAILAALIWYVRSDNLLERLSTLQPGWLVASCVCLATVVVSNNLRWLMLLRGYRVASGFGETLLLYNVSLFFTLFLPGSTGGDLVRSYYLARRHGRLAAVLLATFQERLAGLGALLLLGIAGALLLRATLGVALASTLLLLQLGTVALVLVALFPAPAIAMFRLFWARVAGWQPLARLQAHPLVERLARFLAPATEPLRLARPHIALLALALVGSALFGVATYWSLAQALGVQVPWLAVAVAASVVTLARTLPISLNGIGVGEGAFVLMLAPFGVPQADALAISLAGLALHTLAALVGGVCYAVLLSRGVRVDAVQEVTP